MTPCRLPSRRHPGTLGQVAARDASMLTLTRERRESEGRLSVARLIEQQGSTRAARATSISRVARTERGLRRCSACEEAQGAEWRAGCYPSVAG